MPLAAPPAAVDAAFRELLLQHPGLLAQPQQPQHRAALERFCSRWLLPVGADLLPAELPQLAAGPPPGWLPGVVQPDIRQWAEHLFRTWGALCRQVSLRCQRGIQGWLWRPGMAWTPTEDGMPAHCATDAWDARSKLAGCRAHAHPQMASRVLQATPGVAAHPDRHSLLLPPGAEGRRAFVVPGARFREMYYW